MVLVLFTERLDVSFTVAMEDLSPRFFEFGCCDVPVGPTFPGQGARVLADILEVGRSLCSVPRKLPDIKSKSDRLA
jgi:hypothetical protein